MIITLEDALGFGRGIERPFCCPSHPDLHASASVNVAKGWWYCYACKARGRVDGKRVPTDLELMAMLQPETAARIYPPSWLELFDVDDGYWHRRFPDWLVAFMGFGEDPVTGDATFPVHTPEGRLAGVGRRREHGEPRYMYPTSWSASRTLGGTRSSWRRTDVVALVEGYADASACWEFGAVGLACYGSGLHWPQKELIARLSPKLIVNAFDADDAGRAAGERTHELLGDLAEIVDLDWSPAGKDPAEVEFATRRQMFIDVVAASGYGPSVGDLTADMAHRVNAMHADYRKE